MTVETRDSPNVLVFPPLLALGTIVLAICLQWLDPLGWIIQLALLWRIIAGALLMALGTAFLIGGRQALVRNKTNVRPTLPALVLVHSGVYRWTRNPIYVGGILLLLGAAVLFALDWLLLLLLPTILILHFGIIRREEAYLERKFGAPYHDYKIRVPRYLGVSTKPS